MDEKQNPFIFPFLWMHGEDEQTIRQYIRAIHDSNLESFCVESRPHPDFVGPIWWRDMDIVLDEARKLGMQVWILDDSHFPTGYAAGAMNDAPDALCRQSLVYQMIDCPKSGEWMEITLRDCAEAPAFQPTLMEQYSVDWSKARYFDDDRLVGIVAVKTGGNTRDGLLDLSAAIGRETLRFQVPEGQWRLCLLHLTRNRGPHRDYINMMSAASCRKLIDAVYEPHWAHYEKEFGKTIAGFFSDEPEIGNGHLYEIAANDTRLDDGYRQLDLFTDFDALEKEKSMQRAMLHVRRKYGLNAVVKGMNLLDGATIIARNQQIGGHRAGSPVENGRPSIIAGSKKAR